MAKIGGKSRKIQFQIGWGGLIALTMATICVFLWMFILGFWVGQKLVGRTLDEPLRARAIPRSLPEEQKIISLIPEKVEVSEPDKEINQQTTKWEKSAPPATPNTKKDEQPEPRLGSIKKDVRDTVDIKRHDHQIRKTKDGRYFALQVASYREKERADKEAGRWRDKGYRTVIRRVELGSKKEIFYRVHLGEYSSVEEATSSAKKLAQKYNLQSYIVPIND
nr:SPOR domain-containing protein [Deltaproteobacteria bacterium]